MNSSVRATSGVCERSTLLKGRTIIIQQRGLSRCLKRQLTPHQTPHTGSSAIRLRPRAASRISTGASSSPSASESEHEMQNPATFFPDTNWPAQKAPPKASLVPLNQAQHAGELTLNVVEFIHWLAFPLGFYVAHYIFVEAPVLATYLNGDTSRVFFLMLGLMCQVMGGICGIQMHMYEGWQVTPFRNLLELPPTAKEPLPPTPAEVDETRVINYNNAWLRAVAYHILFTFQTLGLSFFSLGVFGYTPEMKALLGMSVAVALVWRRKPQLSEAEPKWLWRFFCERTVNGVTYPIMPLSVWLFVMFMANTLVNLWAYKEFFGPDIAAVWPPSLLPWLAPLKSEWWAVLAPLIVAAGGFIEGYFVETSFDQRMHGLAVIIMLMGVGLHYPMYWHMVQSASAMVGV
ncbi:hypothetical protein Vafri_16772 [Volvox africanus]|uniref:Uncharacterized protein n=2 Tax=Volvox africanus TaxID=51714 RepID=A0A8J4BJH6_9CHLO|nr:hypothetical protein Vafri_16772 [Volvox africanus]